MKFPPAAKNRVATDDQYDPVFLHARREALFILGLFAACVTWSIFVCYNYGYLDPGEERAVIRTILGMPSWVFWGIAVPWVVVDIATVWFCFFFMVDDDLGEAHEGDDLAEQIEHMHEREEARHD